MKKYFRNIAVGGLVLLTGCNNFLDVVPDDRTEIKLHLLMNMKFP